MQWTDEQIETIEDLAGMGWVPEDIAKYFGIDEGQFMDEFHDDESTLRYHYDRGSLITKARVDRDNLRRAKDGNLTSLQMVEKKMRHRDLENYKKRQDLIRQQQDYENLQALVQRGEVHNLPERLVNYFEQMDYIRCLFNKWESKTYIVSMVILKWPNLSAYQATQLYYDTLNFFYLDNQVKVEAWQNIYADRLDSMAATAREINDFKIAGQLTMDAAKLRGVGKEKPSELPPEIYDRRPVINIIDPKMFGITKVNRRKLAEFLDSLDLSESEKLSLRRDAGMEETYVELIESSPDAESEDSK